MKSKAPLALMEQILMVLVFALAAGLCLQMFVFSSQMSHRCEANDRAALVVQNVAEVWKLNRGDAQICAQKLGGECSGDTWQIGYSVDWVEMSTDEAEYLVRVVPVTTDNPLLSCADVIAQTSEGDRLIQIRIGWQEVDDE